MRISDWSSDVCSSDLPTCRLRTRPGDLLPNRPVPRRRLPLHQRKETAMKTARMLAAAALVAAIAWTSHASLAQLPGTSRTDLLRPDLSAPGREVIQVLVELAPRAAAPRHSHPGAELYRTSVV